MATAIDFPERNDWIGRPENQSNHQCYALPIARIINWMPGVIPAAPPQRMISHISCWQFSPEELQEIIKNEGKCFVLIQSTTTYPFSVHGQFPLFKYDDSQEDILLTEEQVKQLKS